ncbi:hypothetical protein CDV36_002382 [Fusarium kuroshium]|uniref:Uncharacterized protein n=1 Tax=Fusarium kuroshium TaxID=2010991 RepID=A0A3M2SLF5_9HYPO|nr:hypothetical protein CDV36_002382 [Fusarium kuroshium]
MSGKLTVDPIASFPLALSLRRFPIRRLVSSHLINAFFSFLRPHRKAWEVSTKHTATRATFAIPPPSSPSVLPFLSHPNPSIHRSLQLSGSRRPPKGHCTNAPEVAGADKKTNPIPSIHPIPSERPACCTPSPDFSASLVPSKPTRVP